MFMSLFVWNPLLPAWCGTKFWHRGSLKEKVWPVYESKLPSSMNAYVLFLNYHEFNILGSSDSRAMTCIYVQYIYIISNPWHDSATNPPHRAALGGVFHQLPGMAASSLVQRAMGCAAQIISLKTFDMTPARENANLARFFARFLAMDRWMWGIFFWKQLGFSTIWMCHEWHSMYRKMLEDLGRLEHLLAAQRSHLPFPPAGLKPGWYGMDSPMPWWQDVILNSLDFRMLISRFESNDL